MLSYLALGWDTNSITEKMGLRPRTMRNHSTNLHRKLDVQTSCQSSGSLTEIFTVFDPSLGVL